MVGEVPKFRVFYDTRLRVTCCLVGFERVHLELQACVKSSYEYETRGMSTIEESNPCCRNRPWVLNFLILPKFGNLHRILAENFLGVIWENVACFACQDARGGPDDEVVNGHSGFLNRLNLRLFALELLSKAQLHTWRFSTGFEDFEELGVCMQVLDGEEFGSINFARSAKWCAASGVWISIPKCFKTLKTSSLIFELVFTFTTRNTTKIEEDAKRCESVTLVTAARLSY